ncbi:MAG: Ig-like domain-containing protein [Crocinitomicaceae bacterium]|nr:Ig-like domain-containing protein [Crocinitomicaceae bacterium]
MKYFLIAIVFIVSACAQINDLTGGADDDYAPQIDSAKSFPFNGQTNFEGDRVVLKFEEYITLVKPNDNILITPRPEVAPIISAHNKTLEILFVAPLQENTTYTINFNRAIADITEKNDSIFQYVFSTGNYIDSLSISGNVKDAFTNKGSDGFIVALYPMTNEIQFDSIPYLTKPTYISQTDKDGNYKINYLKYGLYYLFAFDDRNKNLKLDDGENIAFLPEKNILVNRKNIRADLKSFSIKSSESEVDHVNFVEPGKLEIIFTFPPDSFTISTSCALLQEDTKSQDSLVFWLAENPTARMKFATRLNGIEDTLKPLYKSSIEAKFMTAATNIKEGKLQPGEKLKLTFSEPILLESISTEKIRVMTSDSTVITPVWEIENLRTLVLTNPIDQAMILQLDSGAVNSLYNHTNANKININFENYPISYYGSLVINTDSVFNAPVLVYLLDAKGNAIDTTIYSKQIEFKNIPPGDYQLRLVVDEDNNGEWSSGSLTLGVIPEKVIYFNETIAVKSKWVKEVDWFLKDLNK